MSKILTDQGFVEVGGELYHYGVQGMHWGIRRYQPYGSGGYDPKKKGKFLGKINAKMSGHYKNISDKYRRKANSITKTGVLAIADYNRFITAAEMYEGYSKANARLAQKRGYEAYDKLSNKPISEILGIDKNRSNIPGTYKNPNETRKSVTGKTTGGQKYEVSPMQYNDTSGYGTGKINLGNGRKLQYGGFTDSRDTAEGTIPKLMNNFEEYEKKAKKLALDDASNWWNTSDYSNKQKQNFKDNLKAQYVSVYDDDFVGLSFYTSDYNHDLMGGHSIDVEINLKTGKMIPGGING